MYPFDGWYLLRTTLGASIATGLCALILGVRKKKAVLAGTGIGGFGWMLYLLVSNTEPNRHYGVLLGILVATIAVAIGSQIAARICKTAATVFLIPSLYPLVPGVLLYEMAFAFFRNELLSAVDYGVQALLTAAAIALGILIVDSLLIAWGVIKRQRKERRRRS